MPIRRCPYCRAIIDERDRYCNACGTQLLFPEDEQIEEDIPGEKIVVSDAATPKAKTPRKSSKKQESAFIFPEDYKATPLSAPTAREKVEPPQAEGGASRGVTEMDAPAEESRFSPLPSARDFRTPPPPPSDVEDDGLTPLDLGKPLTASNEEIEDIARLLSSFEREEQVEIKRDEKAAPGPKSGATPFFEKDLSGLRSDRLPPMATPPDRVEPKEKASASWDSEVREQPSEPTASEEPAQELAGEEVEEPLEEPAADLHDIIASYDIDSSLPPLPPLDAEDIEPGAEQSWPSSRTGDIPQRDPLYEERMMRSSMARPIRRKRGGASKIMAKVFDLFVITLCWSVGVLLATRVLSVSLSRMFAVAALPLVLFYVALLAAYFFLFLYFLGETLGDRLSSSAR